MNLRDAPPGWRYKGESKGGLWGMFVPDTQREYTEAERTAYKQRQAKQELKRRLAYSKSLSEAERDRQCNKLIDQLPLYSHHRGDLKRRGLSDKLISAGKFRSVDQFHRLDFEVSYNLAGVDISGRSLTNKITGYIVPIWNESRQIIGYQILDILVGSREVITNLSLPSETVLATFTAHGYSGVSLSCGDFPFFRLDFWFLSLT